MYFSPHSMRARVCTHIAHIAYDDMNEGATKENHIECVPVHSICSRSIFFLLLPMCSAFYIKRFDMNGGIMCCSPCEFHYNSIFSPPHHVWDELMCIMSKSVNCCCDCLLLYQSEQFFALAASFA